MRFISSIPCLIFSLFFVAVAQVQAVETKIDYQLQGAVYQWFGLLDQSNQAITTKNSQKVIKHLNQKGAHHLLSITTVDRYPSTTEVEVELEFLPKPSRADEEIHGHYVIQTLLINPVTGEVSRSDILQNDIDDFTSRFRSSSDNNLIKGFLYHWTQLLDNASVANTDQPLQVKNVTTNTRFNSEERNLSVQDYIAQLQTLNAQSSRRAIKYLKITPAQAPHTFTVDYQYQWNLVNQDGEPELAQIGVTIKVMVKNGQVLVQEYKANYLPPVTDLGAEIRC
ncbi:MAG: hypothetical protein ACPGUD_12140 [Parashewanella sp.]